MVQVLHSMQTLAILNFFIALSSTQYDVLKQTYCAEILGKLNNFKPVCLLDDEHEGQRRTYN
jgi:hypothetical protein